MVFLSAHKRIREKRIKALVNSLEVMALHCLNIFNKYPNNVKLQFIAIASYGRIEDLLIKTMEEV